MRGGTSWVSPEGRTGPVDVLTFIFSSPSTQQAFWRCSSGGTSRDSKFGLDGCVSLARARHGLLERRERGQQRGERRGRLRGCRRKRRGRGRRGWRRHGRNGS